MKKLILKLLIYFSVFIGAYLLLSFIFADIFWIKEVLSSIGGRISVLITTGGVIWITFTIIDEYF